MANKSTVPPPMKKSMLLKMKLERLLNKACVNLRPVLSIALIAASLGYITIKAPEIHGLYLRHEVGSRTYMIKGKVNGGGGTGFAVKAASGQTYIVTNSHVCEGVLSQSDDKTALLVMDDNGLAMRRRIIEISDFTDLCILEGLPGVEGLELGQPARLGEHAYVVGHPRLRPLSISEGEIVGAQDVQIATYVMKTGDPEKDAMFGAEEGLCNAPKNKIEEVKVDFMGIDLGTVRICTNVTKAAYNTTIVIFPGNSGSPMVDWRGRLEGVAFASDGTGWGVSVSFEDLQKFLSHY